jgi:hypothetical protein
VTLAGEGGVSSSPDGIDCPAVACSAQFDRVCEGHCLHRHEHAVGQAVSLSAERGFLWSWSGACARRLGQRPNECTVVVDPDRTVGATFGPAPDTVAPSVTVTPHVYALTAAWAASADDHWVGGYDVFVDGVLVQRRPWWDTATRIDRLSCETEYAIRVVAFDANDNRAGSHARATTKPCGTTPPPDVTPPDTHLHTHTARLTAGRRAVFELHASEARSTFACRLDGHPWAACRSPKVYRRLEAGRHTFRVRAIDAAGNADPTPAVWRWRIER